jgi:hypothetical protein
MNEGEGQISAEKGGLTFQKLCGEGQFLPKFFFVCATISIFHKKLLFLAYYYYSPPSQFAGEGVVVGCL